MRSGILAAAPVLRGRASYALLVTLGLLAVAAPRPTAAQVSGQLSMQSDLGDYIGGGQNYSYSSSSGDFSAQTFGSGERVTISFRTPDFSEWWYLEFSTNETGVPLAPGFYPNAERASFASPGHPGLDIYGNGRGCNTLTGEFTVNNVSFDYSSGSARLVEFDASFEQHCEGGEPALRGSLSFVDNSDHTFPQTTASLAGLTGSNGWYRSPVQVTLTATDAGGPTDVAATYYSVDFGPTQTYMEPFTVSGDGSHTVLFWSVDRSGNQESTQSLSLNIDATAPVITEAAAMELLRTQKGYTALTTVSGKITDALSGLVPSSATYSVADEYKLDQPSGQVQVQSDGSYSFTLLLDASRNNSDKDGRTYVITIKASDSAGNTGTHFVTLIVPRR
jgi:hypothetical protein